LRKLKSVISIFVAVALICCLSLTSFAATLDQDHTSADVPVVYKAGQLIDDPDPDDPTDDVMGGTYIVTIPDYIVAAGVGEAPSAYNVTASEVLIPYGTNLTVALAFTGELSLRDNTATKIPYEMRNAGTAITSGDTILTVAAGTPTATTTTAVSAIITSAPLYAGVYLDTATFTVSVA